MLEIRTLEEQIRKAGVESDDTVIIHTSLRSVGEVENGADGFIDSFKECLSDGLFLVPTFTYACVNKKQPYFNVKETKPCIGAVPTVAAFRPDGVRSLHPTHSVAAFGERRYDYVRDEIKTRTPTPPGGCMARLYDEHAKILLIGVGHNKNTFIHYIDELADTPNRLGDERTYIDIDYDGKELPHIMRPHFTPGTPDVSANFVKFTDLLAREGATHKAKLGNADVTVCDAVRLCDILCELFLRAKKLGIDLCKDGTPLDSLIKM